MKELTLRKIAEACHGTVTPEAETVTVTGVQSDSRRVRPGDLFVAIKGEKADGHDFVAMAAASARRPRWSQDPWKRRSPPSSSPTPSAPTVIWRQPP